MSFSTIGVDLNWITRCATIFAEINEHFENFLNVAEKFVQVTL